MFNSIFEGATTSSISTSSLFICISISLILGFLIALVHKLTSSYSKNFLITICLLPVMVMSVMLMVNGNLGTSVAIMGAFSLVRFRSLPGTSKEILTVFFAMAVGLATGMGQIWFSILLTIVGCLMILLLNKINIFEKDALSKVLKVTIPENLDYTNVFDDIFAKYLKDFKLIKSKTTNMGSMYEITYNVKLKDGKEEKNFIDEIRTRNGNLKIILSSEYENLDL